jgi:hypothetical protein
VIVEIEEKVKVERILRRGAHGESKPEDRDKKM